MYHRLVVTGVSGHAGENMWLGYDEVVTFLMMGRANIARSLQAAARLATARYGSWQTITDRDALLVDGPYQPVASSRNAAGRPCPYCPQPDQLGEHPHLFVPIRIQLERRGTFVNVETVYTYPNLAVLMEQTRQLRAVRTQLWLAARSFTPWPDAQPEIVEIDRQLTELRRIPLVVAEADAVAQARDQYAVCEADWAAAVLRYWALCAVYEPQIEMARDLTSSYQPS
ncbi:hypothetical protein HJC99_06860 [Candidatus Saccharibacteria bacterium]|nr:hypothetical protein [Candidatus Saccharibacteria bacterium]